LAETLGIYIFEMINPDDLLLITSVVCEVLYRSSSFHHDPVKTWMPWEISWLKNLLLCKYKSK
jgi:hypothetical protein